MKSRVVRTALAVAVVVVVAAAYWAVGRMADAGAESAQARDSFGRGPAAAVSGTAALDRRRSADLAGGYRDHVTLLNFWGTWCPPCRNELPHIAELRQRFAGREAFRLLAVSCPPGGQADDVQSLQEDTASLLKRLGLDLPTYYDPDDATQSALGSSSTWKPIRPPCCSTATASSAPFGSAIAPASKPKWSDTSARSSTKKQAAGKATRRHGEHGGERTRNRGIRSRRCRRMLWNDNVDVVSTVTTRRHGSSLLVGMAPI